MRFWRGEAQADVLRGNPTSSISRQVDTSLDIKGGER